ncbi:MAG: hypothetical protein VX640_02150 [Pseudomonadota bacterium]|nr:hypothetical protein [Pseudomonadota bacterium]
MATGSYRDDTEEDANRPVIHVSESETESHLAVDLTCEQVRQGHTGDHVRYILLGSLAAVVVAMFGAMMMFAG